MQAWQRAVDAGHPVDLTVVGHAPKLPPGVQALGRVPQAEMPRIYQGHDLLLELARANCAGVTMTDAAHAGLPVIATRTGGVEDIVVDGASGFLVPGVEQGEGTVVSAAVRQIAMAVTDRERLRAMRSASVNHATSALTWDRWARIVVGMCDRVIAGPGPLPSGGSAGC